MDSNLEPIIEGNDRGEIMCQVLNCDRAKIILGFEPRTSLEDGLRKTIEYYKGVIDV